MKTLNIAVTQMFVALMFTTISCRNINDPERRVSSGGIVQGLPSTKQASAHLCIDNNSIVQCVLNNDVAFATPGANNNGIQLEIAGIEKQSTVEWDDAYSKALLEIAANAAAQYCLKYNLPRNHLSKTELKAEDEGIIGYVQASEVFNRSTHIDPGKNFPWEEFIARVEHFYLERRTKLGLPLPPYFFRANFQYSRLANDKYVCQPCSLSLPVKFASRDSSHIILSWRKNFTKSLGKSSSC
jgi:hypothetical protein